MRDSPLGTKLESRWTTLKQAGRFLLHGVTGSTTVLHLVQPHWPTVREDTRLSVAAALAATTGRNAYPVVDDRGHFLGLLRVTHLDRVNPERWPSLNVDAVALTSSLVPSLKPHDSISTALERMEALRVNELPAVEGERYLGMVSREQIHAGASIRSGSIARFRPLQGGTA